MTEQSVRPAARSNGGRLIGIACAGLGLVTLMFGLWAFLEPHFFFRVIATYKPYNRHFLHDAGALQIGLGGTLLLAALRRSAGVVALGGFVLFESLHVASHFVDRDLGGNPALDITFLVILTAIGAGALIGLRRNRQEGPE